ncbi:23S rRNA (guanosine(2251)-2'-O)-methyltransferase RlmB [Arachidicoccus ginsenosidivorans]|uniref:23S rRNA (Guanosine(2251)-2'-O)-methyltransferase RlmB n=1 Tax=Arachidicoccus ginsenosidivorans TaxID=496057 RepID=A0A5B8VQL9_9BACT|nr:23S rRNA (guanosine(2251)-2'-O)-methyltransferase RlmB [Arachidicoccus ginsenosidivorans]QEC72996.1 23S rRNA (guanosine(2251)-2'-O)-methyltransferase RlmB [Arachidicoccus ginsenosidivorans]
MAFQKKSTNNYQSKKNIIVGRNPVIEALKEGVNIDKILIFKNASGEAIQTIRNQAKKLSIPVQPVPQEKLYSLTNINHQGVIAFKSAVTYQDLQQVVDLIVGNGEVPQLLMLDGVTDVRNIGGIARSALCTGTQAIIIPDKGVGALGEDAVKSSAGALEQIHICRVSSLLNAVELLQLNGISIFTSEMNGEKKLYELDLTLPCCFVMGSEDNGVQSYISKAANDRYQIPMVGNFDSLNVSVAAGITLYEAMKQRMQQTAG